MAKLVSSARTHKHSIKTKVYEDSKSWEVNCSLKAEFIREMLGRKPIMFLDADCWLTQPLKLYPAELGLVITPPDNIRLGQDAFKYRRFAKQNNGMWNSGVMYLTPTQPVVNLVNEWVNICKSNPHQWDQISLQQAWIFTGRKVKVLPIRPVGISHDSAHHRYWPAPTKWLILGSAPYVKDWWLKHAHKFSDFYVGAINNSWLVPDRLDVWFRPNDFDGPRAVGDHYENPNNWRTVPYWEEEIRTTMIDTLHHLMNCHLAANRKVEVHVAGSDFIYKSGQRNHFYGDGGWDPLRFGQGKLITALNNLHMNFKLAGCPIYNAGDQVETLLPFSRSPLI